MYLLGPDYPVQSAQHKLKTSCKPLISPSVSACVHVTVCTAVCRLKGSEAHF